MSNRFRIFLCFVFLLINSLSISASPKPPLTTIKLLARYISISPGPIKRNSYFYSTPKKTTNQNFGDINSLCKNEFESGWEFSHPTSGERTKITFKIWPIQVADKNVKLLTAPVKWEPKSTQLPLGALKAIAQSCAYKTYSYPKETIFGKFSPNTTIEVEIGGVSQSIDRSVIEFQYED